VADTQNATQTSVIFQPDPTIWSQHSRTSSGATKSVTDNFFNIKKANL
jgi:hypothetical protein